MAAIQSRTLKFKLYFEMKKYLPVVTKIARIKFLYRTVFKRVLSFHLIVNSDHIFFILI